MPTGIYQRIDPITAFLSKFKAGDGCWIWEGAKFGAYRYGAIKVHGKNYRAHRYSYELFNGPIPDGKQVLHQCDVRECVNPTHLTLGTHKDNMREMAERNTVAWGERQAQSTLTAGEVGEIRRLFGQGMSIYRLATIYDCSECAITGVVKGQTWKRIFEKRAQTL